MARYSFKTNDTRPLVATLRRIDGAAIKLGVPPQQATVRFRMRPVPQMGSGGVAIDADCEVLEEPPDDPASTTNKNQGKVRYQWAEGETEAPGVFDAEFEVTFADGTVESVPNGPFEPGDRPYETIEIIADLGS